MVVCSHSICIESHPPLLEEIKLASFTPNADDVQSHETVLFDI